MNVRNKHFFWSIFFTKLAEESYKIRYLCGFTYRICFKVHALETTSTRCKYLPKLLFGPFKVYYFHVNFTVGELIYSD